MNVVETKFHGPADRRSALDRAHRGDILGAFGSVASHDTEPRRGLRRRLSTLAAIAGPGVVVLVAGNDAGGVSVYAQAGQDHGLRLLWVLLLLAPVLFVNQEMAARLGAVTGAGHARLIFERFGRVWGAFAFGDLLVLNLFTAATDFFGMNLALGYLGINRYVAIPAAVVLLIAVASAGGYRRWERAMCAMVAVDLLLVPLALLVHGPQHPSPVATLHGTAPNAVFLVIALVGTTATPWQLFLQQSSVVDKRVTARWVAYARLDTALGTAAMVLGAAVVMVVCATAFDGTALAGRFTDAGAVARGLRLTSGGAAAAIFAVVLLNASMLGAAAVTLSSAYAVGDVLGVKHSLHRRWADGATFRIVFVLTIGAAALFALVPAVPVGLITTSVQALAGVLLPSASVFLLLLCNDPVVLGPRTNPRWLNALGALAVGVFVVLSAQLMVTTALPRLDARALLVVLGGVGAVFFVAWGVVLAIDDRRRGQLRGRGWWERKTWTMPAIESLSTPSLTRGRRFGLVLLRGYLLLAAAAIVAKIVGLAL
jgi:Mn2+/Fe2+ NRAMP family transporter